jgi:hypothetical protein
MLFYTFKMAVAIAFLRKNAVEGIKIIEINKTFWGDNNLIALKQQLLGIILCFFMYSKWPWLLQFFAKVFIHFTGFSIWD